MVNNIKRAVAVLNPITTFRDLGPEGLKDQLDVLDIKQVITIARRYTPDLSTCIYRKKINKIIEYVIIRSDGLSKTGQVLRMISNNEKDDDMRF